MRREIPLAGVLALAAGAGPAGASVFDTYGFGARGAAMANAQAAAAEDFSAVYYNPAALTVHKRPHVGTVLTVVAPSVSVRRHATSAGPAVERPDPNAGITLGLLFPLGGKIENRFALALGAYLPTVEVTRVDARDERTPQFYRYEALPDKIVVAPALAFEAHRTVSFGLGLQVLGALDGGADVELDLLNQRFTRKTLSVDVDTATGLTAGLLVRPNERLRLAFAWRDALALDYHLRTNIDIKDVGALDADISGTSLYTPAQYTGGLAWSPIGDLTVAFDLVYARWSAAPDPTARFDVTLDGAPLGQGALAAESPPVALGASDTLSPRLGVEWRPRPVLALRTGYQLSPTPLPAQTERTNYIDSTAHQVGAGVGYAFADPLGIHASPLTIDLAAQWTHLADREHRKRDARDAMGDFAASGDLFVFSLTVRHDFQ